MDDPTTAVDPAAAAGPDPAPALDPPAPAAAAPAPPAPEPDHFPRSYVEELRQQAAGYRTKAKPYEDAFDGYTDEDRAALLEFTKLLKENPAAAADWMAQQAEHLRAASAPPPPDPDADRPLTRAELDRTLAEREQREAEAKALNEIHSEARGLGYDPASAEAQDRLAFMELTFLAAEVTGGDLAKAHEMRQAQQAQAVQSFLDRKSREAADAPDPSPQAGGAAPASQPPKTFEEARARMTAAITASPVR